MLSVLFLYFSKDAPLVWTGSKTHSVLIIARPKTRVILNAEAAALTLRQAGISTIVAYSGKLPPVDMIKMIQHATIVVAVHGAECTFASFMCSRSAVLVELGPDPNSTFGYHSIFEFYKSTAPSYLYAEYTDVGQWTDGTFTANVTMNLTWFGGLIESLVQ